MVEAVRQQVFLQALYYLVVVLLSVVIVGFVQRGFFWKYMKVRMSFGKLLLVKVKNPVQDWFAVGAVEDGFLVYSSRGSEVRMNVPAGSIYRCMAVNWVNVDEEKNAVFKEDYSAVSGYDAKKYDNLFVRCLTRPGIMSTKDKLILAGVVIGALAAVAAAVFSVVGYFEFKDLVPVLKGTIEGLLSNMAGVVPAS